MTLIVKNTRGVFTTKYDATMKMRILILDFQINCGPEKLDFFDRVEWTM